MAAEVAVAELEGVGLFSRSHGVGRQEQLASVAGEGAEYAERLAAFAMGCLGATSRISVGKQLGLMGSTTFAETLAILQHLETLALRRAAKLAGCRPNAAPPKCEESLGKAFCEALLAAVQANSLDELFERLPHDSNGRADVCTIFGVTTSAYSVGTPERSTSGTTDFTSEYVDNPADLPFASPSVFAACERALLENAEAVADDRWEIDVSAINGFRGLIAGAGAGATAPHHAVPVGVAVLKALAARCGSRRPALAKTALRCLSELAEAKFAAKDVWVDAIDDVLKGCLASLKGTKVVARVGEEALSLCIRQFAAVTSIAAASKAVAGCTATILRSRPAQPSVVAGCLHILARLVPGIVALGSWEEAEDVESLRGKIRALCEDVLATRALGPCFGDARGILRALPTVPGSAQSSLAPAITS